VPANIERQKINKTETGRQFAIALSPKIIALLLSVKNKTMFFVLQGKAVPPKCVYRRPNTKLQPGDGICNLPKYPLPASYLRISL
jgi:hypothetical protein